MGGLVDEGVRDRHLIHKTEYLRRRIRRRVAKTEKPPRFPPCFAREAAFADLWQAGEQADRSRRPHFDYRG